MERQLFATGQCVNVADHSLSGPSRAGCFRVVRRYLIENMPAIYRIRSVAGLGERMVPEGELSAVAPKFFDRAKRLGNVLPLFPEAEALDRRATT